MWYDGCDSSEFGYPLYGTNDTLFTSEGKRHLRNASKRRTDRGADVYT